MQSALSISVALIMLGLAIHECWCYRQYQNVPSDQDRNTSFGLQLSLTLNLLSVGVCYILFPSSNLTYSVIGFVLFLMGVLLRYVSIYTLKNLFTWKIHIHQDHRLVRHGVYKLLRHPSYSGGLMAMLGLNLTFGAFYSLLLLAFLHLPLVLYRIKIEERMLESAFRDDFKIYSQQSYKLVPFIY